MQCLSNSILEILLYLKFNKVLSIEIGSLKLAELNELLDVFSKPKTNKAFSFSVDFKDTKRYSKDQFENEDAYVKWMDSLEPKSLPLDIDDEELWGGNENQLLKELGSRKKVTAKDIYNTELSFKKLIYRYLVMVIEDRKVFLDYVDNYFKAFNPTSKTKYDLPTKDQVNMASWKNHERVIGSILEEYRIRIGRNDFEIDSAMSDIPNIAAFLAYQDNKALYRFYEYIMLLSDMKKLSIEEVYFAEGNKLKIRIKMLIKQLSPQEGYFIQPPGTKWEDISFKIISRNEKVHGGTENEIRHSSAEITVMLNSSVNRNEELNFEKLGFLNKQKKNSFIPRREWLFFLSFCNGNVKANRYDDSRRYQNVTKMVSVTNQILKDIFGIPGYAIEEVNYPSKFYEKHSKLPGEIEYKANFIIKKPDGLPNIDLEYGTGDDVLADDQENK